MDVFQEYKPTRNKVALLSVEDLASEWAYCQYLQIDDFHFAPEIEVADLYLELDVPQSWISEWELEAPGEGISPQWERGCCEGTDVEGMENFERAGQFPQRSRKPHLWSLRLAERCPR